MRVNNVFSGRPAYWDRNPLDVGKSSFLSGQAPHGTTTRYTYTVPSNRKASVESAMTMIIRNTAATTPLAVDAYIQVVVGGVTIILCWSKSLQNAVAVSDKSLMGLIGFLLAGDVLTGVDADVSTGGTCEFNSSVKCLEFDA